MSGPRPRAGDPTAGPAADDAPAPVVPAGVPGPLPSDGERPSSRDDVTDGRLAATVERLRGEVRAAHAAAEGRALIELAKGVLVERLGCGPAQAARQLAALSDQAGLSRLELAADIINEAARDRVAEVADEFVRTVIDEPDTAGPAASVAVRLRTAESAALSADDTQAVADTLLAHALEPLGAVAVAIWTTGADGSLSLRGHAGFGPDEAARWHYVPPGVTTAARQALTGRRTVWYPSLSAAGIPSIGRARHPDGGRVVVPAGTGGRIHGVLEIDLQEVVVEEEDPRVPVRDEVQGLLVAVGVGVRAEQRVVVGVEVVLLPHPGTLQHPHRPRPVPGVRAGGLQMGIEPRRIRNIEVRHNEGLRHVLGGLPVSGGCCPAHLYPSPVRRTRSPE